MDSFDVIISPKALSQLNNYIDYLQHTLLNDQAAYNVWQDALDTQKQLSKIEGSLKLCSHSELKKNGSGNQFFAASISYALPGRRSKCLCGCYIPPASGL